MQPFKTLTAIAAPLDRTTSTPTRSSPSSSSSALSAPATGSSFFDWRRKSNGDPNPESSSTTRATRVLNTHRGKKLRLRVEPRTRRLGPQRLRFPRSIAPLLPTSFSPTPAKNGIVLVRLSERRSLNFCKKRKRTSGYELTVSLEAQKVTDAYGFHATFEVDPSQFCLLEGPMTSA